MDGAEAAYRAAIASDSGHVGAHSSLGHLLEHDLLDWDGAEEAYRAAIAAELSMIGNDSHHFHVQLGTLLHKKLKDIDGAEAAYRAAIAAGPELCWAHKIYTRLGALLQHERKDLDGAAAAYRKAILSIAQNSRHEAEPSTLEHRGFVTACAKLSRLRGHAAGTIMALREAIKGNPELAAERQKLGPLLIKRAKEIESGGGGGLVTAAALYEEAAAHVSAVHGAHQKGVKSMLTKAAALREAAQAGVEAPFSGKAKGEQQY